MSFRAPFLQDLEVASERLDVPDMAIVAQEDEQADEEGRPPRYSVHIPVGATFQNSGSWFELKGGARIWRLRLEAPDALATTLLFDEFDLPIGSRLYVYNDDHSSVIGAFSSMNNEDGGTYATQLVYGDACIIEYFEPGNVRGQGNIEISHLGYGYRYVYPAEFDAERGGSQSCEVDVNCSPEGNNWQDEKRGVVRVGLVFPNGGSWCTGSMVNNTSLDCSPYILTALHCTEGSSSNNFGQYTFYFNYETSGCGSGSAPTNQTVVGCAERANSGDGGGNSGSDFSLLEATSSIPSGYNVYYNGWNAQTSASTSGVGIHHPAGDRKKISTYSSQLTTTGWGINNTHWRVYWVGTSNGHGVTEGGSSGSPLFDNQGRIVGTLTGGGSYCSQVPNPSPDSYGKMSYHWQSNPGDDLKVWLDPGNTGALTLAGTYAPCTPAVQYDAGISDIEDPAGVLCTGSIDPVVTLTNYGSITLTTVNIYYNVDGNGTQLYQWSGSLGTNQSTTVNLPSMNVSAGNHTFNAYTTQPNSQTDENSANDSDASAFSITIADSYITLVINTDNYGEETTWSLTQSGGGVVATGGPYTNGVNEQIVQEICVQSGTCYTFVINDDEGDGICCGYGLGSYSIGDEDAILINTGGEFGSSETTQFCVPSTSDCEPLYDPFDSNASGYALYPNNNGGYIAGSNSFGDLAKAQQFSAPNQPSEISGIVVWIAAKDDDGASVTANLYSLNGQGTDLGGATNSAPGTILASATKQLSRVDTSAFLTRFDFNSSVTVSTGYAVGLDFSGFGNNDEIGIVTNTDGDANNADLAWEKWSDGDWYSMNQAWNSQNDGDFDLAIFPVLCPLTVTGVEDLSGQFNLFPNPNNGSFTILNMNSAIGKLEIFDALGKTVYTESIQGETRLNIDLENQLPGIYIVRVMTENGLWNSRIVIQ